MLDFEAAASVVNAVISLAATEAEAATNHLASVGSAIVQILLPAIVALGGLAITQLRNWLGTQTHNAQIKGALGVLTDLVTMVVREMEQTTVQTLRAHNGRLDKEVAEEVKQAAILKIQLLYGPEGLRNLSKRLGTSDDATMRLIGALIEQAVYLIKNPPPPPAAQPGTGDVFDPGVFGGMTEAEKASQAAQSRAVAATGSPL